MICIYNPALGSASTAGRAVTQLLGQGSPLWALWGVPSALHAHKHLEQLLAQFLSFPTKISSSQPSPEVPKDPVLAFTTPCPACITPPSNGCCCHKTPPRSFLGLSQTEKNPTPISRLLADNQLS